MAGWIKWNKGLTKRSEVLQMAARTKKDRRLIALACMELWEWADDETTDGWLPGCTAAFVDDLVGIRGFASAYAEAGWSEIKPDGTLLRNWERHNGESAKRRALDARSKEERRTSVRKVSASDVDNKRTEVRTASGQSADQRREEKRREQQQQGFPLCAGSSAAPDAVACPPAAAPAAAGISPILQALHDRGIGEPTASTLVADGVTGADISAVERASDAGDGPGLWVHRLREAIAQRASTARAKQTREAARAAFDALDPGGQHEKLLAFRVWAGANGIEVRHMPNPLVAKWAKFVDWLVEEAGGAA